MVLPVARILPAVRSELINPLVPFNDVANRLVEVDWVVVELSAVKFWRVEEPVARKLVVVAKVERNEVTVRRSVVLLKVSPESPAKDPLLLN